MILAQLPGGPELLVIALIAIILIGVLLIPIALLGTGLYVIFRSGSGDTASTGELSADDTRDATEESGTPPDPD